MRLAESVIAGFLIMLGGIYSYGILQIHGREFVSNEIGPTAFPWMLVVLLAVLSGFLLVGKWSETTRNDVVTIRNMGAAGGKILSAALLLIAYVWTLKSIGFLWTTPIFLGLLSPLYGIRRLSPIAIVGVAVSFTAALYAFLWQLFGVLLP
ncbi:MAG: tripartite tricarboxylate transporter TctB family protein [Nitrospinota bacterium]|jgi:hypothetical protein|nr:tripartite tricarboxylate transporter TctB family protein [Nitrospinota bacterium]